jgi:hypothetical protein
LSYPESATVLRHTFGEHFFFRQTSTVHSVLACPVFVKSLYRLEQLVAGWTFVSVIVKPDNHVPRDVLVKKPLVHELGLVDVIANPVRLIFHIRTEYPILCPQIAPFSALILALISEAPAPSG